MSEQVILWIFGGVITVTMVVLGFVGRILFSHIETCSATSATIARIDTNVARLMEDVGTRETGIRGQVHELSDEVNTLHLRTSLLERRGS